MQSLVNTKTKLLRLKTSLINKIHALYVARGRKLKKTTLASEKGLDKVLTEQWTAIEEIELEIILEQIRSLKAGIKKLDQAIEEEASKLAGYQSLVSMAGIGSLSAGILSSVIGEIKDFETADKLASYARDCAARVEFKRESQSRANYKKRKQDRTDNLGAMQFVSNQEK